MCIMPCHVANKDCLQTTRASTDLMVVMAAQVREQLPAVR